MNADEYKEAVIDPAKRLADMLDAPQIDTAQRRAEAHARLILKALDCVQGAPEMDAVIRIVHMIRREALQEAAKAQCVYCNDPGWEPMSNSGYHQCRESSPSLMRCRATAIHELIDRLREGVEGK